MLVTMESCFGHFWGLISMTTLTNRLRLPQKITSNSKCVILVGCSLDDITNIDNTFVIVANLKVIKWALRPRLVKMCFVIY